MRYPTTPNQLDALARYIAALRPDWRKIRILEQLERAKAISDDVQVVTAAAVNYAVTVRNVTVDGLGSPGMHWRTWGLTNRHGAPFRVATEACSDCGHLHDPEAGCVRDPLPADAVSDYARRAKDAIGGGP